MVNLLYSIISEIQKSMELCAVRLFFTVRNMFEMYCAVVPLHHRKFLESLPQQVGKLNTTVEFVFFCFPETTFVLIFSAPSQQLHVFCSQSNKNSHRISR